MEANINHNPAPGFRDAFLLGAIINLLLNIDYGGVIEKTILTVIGGLVWMLSQYWLFRLRESYLEKKQGAIMMKKANQPKRDGKS